MRLRFKYSSAILHNHELMSHGPLLAYMIIGRHTRSMTQKLVSVEDKMQQGYSYLLTEPVGKNFATDFTPDLSPKQMLELGVFGGVYMRDCKPEFPSDWFTNAKLSLTSRDNRLNYFGVNASQPLKVWEQKGWIHPQDPRGWFQWYCRYNMGRRSADDTRQIKRWKAMKRHVAQLRSHCHKGDELCRRRQRQALLHWAYDSRKI